MAYCTNCGAPVSDNARFCENCGAPIERAAERTSATETKTATIPATLPQEPSSPPSVAERPTQSKLTSRPPAGSSIAEASDGTLRWIFEYSLWRDITVLLTVFKVFFGIGLGLVLLIELFDFIDGSWDITSVQERLTFDATILAIACGFAIVGYVIFALMQGGSYCVMFTMDEETVEFRPLPKEMKRAEAISALNVLMGLATSNPGQVGIGLTTTANNVMVSTFANVRSIQGYPRRGVIKVNEPFAKNQVYVERTDYDFVYDFIRQRCPQAKIRG